MRCLFFILFFTSTEQFISAKHEIQQLKIVNITRALRQCRQEEGRPPWNGAQTPVISVTTLLLITCLAVLRALPWLVLKIITCKLSALYSGSHVPFLL